MGDGEENDSSKRKAEVLYSVEDNGMVKEQDEDQGKDKKLEAKNTMFISMAGDGKEDDSSKVKAKVLYSMEDNGTMEEQDEDQEKDKKPKAKKNTMGPPQAKSTTMEPPAKKAKKAKTSADDYPTMDKCTHYKEFVHPIAHKIAKLWYDKDANDYNYDLTLSEEQKIVSDAHLAAYKIVNLWIMLNS